MQPGKMRLRKALLLALTAGWHLLPPESTRAAPPGPAEQPAPPLPGRSARIANYSIDARLDTANHTITGKLDLEWKNTTGRAQSAFPFHLYWNAFRNNLSTSARGEGRRAARMVQGVDPDRGYGYVQVRSLRLVAGGESDLTPTLRYVQPDDDNADDRTVVEATAQAPVPPDATVRFKIDWVARIPYGDVGRAGWVHDYFFIAQWFPKIGVWWKGAWNCHQFHPTTEFFSDYGVYDVRLTIPKGFVVGATGTPQGDPERNADGTDTVRFVQEDVHDFAWTASPRFLERRGRFDDAGYPPVDIRLLAQPEHAHLANRYIEATKIALRSYGAWGAPYPYGHVTVIDPAWGSASGGMEYPTLFTGGSNIWSPPELQSPEGVTIHECGHQFWYGLVGNNEFEEAWLDEGFNTYHEEKAAVLALGPRGWGRRYFGVRVPGRGTRGGWPVVAPGVWVGRGMGNLPGLRQTGRTDVMVRRGWEYRTPDSYRINSYGKPALTLQTLENLVGDEAMRRIMGTYASRWRFAHPTTEDFIATVNEVTGRDYRWFFEETWLSSHLCDYAITVKNEKARKLRGFADGAGGTPVLASRPPGEREKDFDSEVTVLRLGEVKMPVEVWVEFADGKTRTETWDGQYRWTRFKYHDSSGIRRAVVDPAGKIAIDVDPSNNSWVEEKGVSRRAATKWSLRFLLWLQNLLELHTVLG